MRGAAFREGWGRSDTGTSLVVRNTGARGQGPKLEESGFFPFPSLLLLYFSSSHAPPSHPVFPHPNPIAPHCGFFKGYFFPWKQYLEPKFLLQLISHQVTNHHFAFVVSISTTRMKGEGGWLRENKVSMFRSVIPLNRSDGLHSHDPAYQALFPPLGPHC